MTDATETAVEILPEDRARANCYALIGRLMYGPPDAELLSYIATQRSDDDAAPLAHAWRELQAACRTVPAEEARYEYDDLFIGVGKAPVTLYTAAYAAPQAPDRHLLSLRDQLDAWQLARRREAGESEDHISGVCDVMRWLIETGHGLEAERAFFYPFVAPAMEPLCSAIGKAPRSQFYRHVAAFMLAFHDVERSGFELMGEV